jgi:hypothetical protein
LVTHPAFGVFFHLQLEYFDHQGHLQRNATTDAVTLYYIYKKTEEAKRSVNYVTYKFHQVAHGHAEHGDVLAFIVEPPLPGPARRWLLRAVGSREHLGRTSHVRPPRGWDTSGGLDRRGIVQGTSHVISSHNAWIEVVEEMTMKESDLGKKKKEGKKRRNPRTRTAGAPPTKQMEKECMVCTLACSDS